MIKILAKQHNTKECFICGLDNHFGLKTRFYCLSNHFALAISLPDPNHNSYHGRMHGGIITAILDETIGRAITIDEPDTFAITTKIDVSFKLPVPLDQTLYTIGKVSLSNRRFFSGVAKLLDKDGRVLAIGRATYLRQDLSKLDDRLLDGENWFVEEDSPDKIKEIEEIANRFDYTVDEIEN
jgi:acyl-coenzyme A thioesterase PaaI-like protein